MYVGGHVEARGQPLLFFYSSQMSSINQKKDTSEIRLKLCINFRSWSNSYTHISMLYIYN